MDASVIRCDVDLPADCDEAAELIAAAERLYPNDPLAPFVLNHMRKEQQQAQDEHRCDDEWRA